MATTLDRIAREEKPTAILAIGAVEVKERVHYLDNLRSLAMLGGVFLHGGFAYAHPAQSFWLATDRQSSVAIDAGIWFTHLFRMGLFFLISGYFAKLILARRGMRSFLWQRTIRLVFPFMLYYPFLLGAMALLVVFGLSYIDEPKGLLGLIADAAKSNAESEGNSPKGPPPGTMHLWFLYYLILFTAVGAVASRFSGVSLERVVSRPWTILSMPLVLVPGIVGAGVPVPSPESFVPTWWPFVYHGAFFWAGWQLFGREQFLESMRPYLWPIAGASVLLFIPYYLCLPNLELVSLIANPRPLPIWQKAISILLTAYLSVTLTAVSLLVGQRYFSRSNSGLKFLADASYWVYLVHLPVTIFLQMLMTGLSWSVWLKLSITMAGTFFFCLATYVVFVRYTPLGFLLHGKRSFP